MSHQSINIVVLVFVLIQTIIPYTKATHDNISKVFIVFACHFDAGYTINNNGSTTGAVVNEYFHKHFPSAMKTSNMARLKKGHPYKFMAQSWLVDAFRHCNETNINTQGFQNSSSDLICPNKTAMANFDAAVRRGDINWHAFPFNAEPELFTPELFDAALNLTFRQDDYYGKTKRQTLSQRDVPGLTRNAIPLLSKRGIKGITVGENSQCAPSAVPPLFLWKDEATKTEVVAMYHALGYGGSWPATSNEVAEWRKEALDPASSKNFYYDDNGDLIMRQIANPFDDGPSIHIDQQGNVQGNSSRSEACVSFNPSGVALCYAWKLDNSGPHEYWDSELIFDAISHLFPSVAKENIVASDAFDDFINAVWPNRGKLPVVTAEIGDTWIFGASADPLKMALFRAASRIHAKCAKTPSGCGEQVNGDMSSLYNFERLLMLSGEHTWGWNGGDIKTKSWKNTELETSLKNDRQFQTAVIGWMEQRALLRNALLALPPSSQLSIAVKNAWEEIEGLNSKSLFNTTTMNHAESLVPLKCGPFNMTIGKDGSIIGLIDIDNQRVHVNVEDSNHFIGKLWYQGMDAKYFKTYVNQYIAGVSAIWPEFTAEGLYKPNLKEPEISSNGTVNSISVGGAGDANRVVIRLSFSAASHVTRGAPAFAEIEHRCSGSGFGSSNDDTFSTAITTTVRWWNKTRTHVPETIWMSNIPSIFSETNLVRVMLNKMGMPLDATEVDLGCDGLHHLTCGVHLHGVDDGGVTVIDDDQKRKIIMSSLDTALVSIGMASPVPTPLVVPNVQDGVHFPLVGNIWNTNYPFWYPFDANDKSSQFRFQYQFS
jgi:hypothetical protein